MPVTGTLFGTHVVRGPDDHSGPRQLAVLQFRGLGDAEIHQQGAALRFFEEHVFGLDVAVDDAGPMRSGQRAGQLAEYAMGLP